MHNVKDNTFTQEQLDSIRSVSLADEIERRVDLRGMRAYTIDPFDARDLDDALSAEVLANGNVLIGIHIADVSSYILPGTEIDKEAMERGTSFYLQSEVIHMLPTSLSSGECSLLPGTDKLCVSLLIVFTPTGDVIDVWCGETVIRSRSKLSYNVVDMLLEKYDQKQNLPEDFGFVPKELYDQLLGPQQATVSEIITDLITLRSISRVLRGKKQRFSFNSTELHFNVIQETEKFEGQDITYYKPISLKEKEQNTESHLIVEDFMIFANETIANFITMMMPRESVVRCLAQPSDFDDLFVNFDATSTQALKKSVEELKKNCTARYGPFEYFDEWVSSMLLNNVTSALYTNPGNLVLTEIKKKMSKENLVDSILEKYSNIKGRRELTKNEADAIIKFLRVYFPPDTQKLLLGHFALGSNLYIHFTSPIRRYIDIVAHRLLAHATYILYAQRHNLLSQEKFSKANIPSNVYPSKLFFQDFRKSTTLLHTKDPSAYTFPQIAFSNEQLPYKKQNEIVIKAIKEEIQKEEVETGGTQYFNLDFGFTEKTYKKMPNPGELSAICEQCNQRHESSKNIQRSLQQMYLANVFNTPHLAKLYISWITQQNDTIQLKGFLPALNKSFQILLNNCYSVKLVNADQESSKAPEQQDACVLAENNELIINYLKNPNEPIIDVGYDDVPNTKDINYVINSIFNKERRKANNFIDRKLKRNEDGSVSFKELHSYYLLEDISDDEEVWKRALANSKYIDVFEDRIAPKPLPEPECITLRYRQFDCVTVKATVKYTPFAVFEFSLINPNEDISGLEYLNFNSIEPKRPSEQTSNIE